MGTTGFAGACFALRRKGAATLLRLWAAVLGLYCAVFGWLRALAREEDWDRASARQTAGARGLHGGGASAHRAASARGLHGGGAGARQVTDARGLQGGGAGAHQVTDARGFHDGGVKPASGSSHPLDLGLRQLAAETSGQGTTEYAILVGVLVLMAIVAVVAMRENLQKLWTSITDGINSL